MFLLPFFIFCVYANGIHTAYTLEVHYLLDIGEIAS